MTFSSPIKDVQAAGVRGNASFRQPPGGAWSGTVLGNDGRSWEVLQLELAWEIRNGSDVYAGPDLVQLLRDHLVDAPTNRLVRTALTQPASAPR